MPSRSDLRKLARTRVKDALVLYKNKRLDGAAYLCGYAIEYALKARICTAIGWSDYPPNGKGDYRSFTSHDLDHLLRLCGRERVVKTGHLAVWSKVKKLWNPEMRYNPVGKLQPQDVKDVIECVQLLLKIL